MYFQLSLVYNSKITIPITCQTGKTINKGVRTHVHLLILLKELGGRAERKIILFTLQKGSSKNVLLISLFIQFYIMVT